MALSREATFYEGFFHYWGTTNGNFAISEIVQLCVSFEIKGQDLRDCIHTILSNHKIWNSRINTHNVPWKWESRNQDSEYILLTELESPADEDDPVDFFNNQITNEISLRKTDVYELNLMKVYYMKHPGQENSKFRYQIAFMHSHSTMDGVSFIIFLKVILLNFFEIIFNLNYILSGIISFT